MKNHDRYPRTIQEAFGPYAKFQPEPPAPTWRGYAVAVIIALCLGAISWGVQR